MLLSLSPVRFDYVFDISVSVTREPILGFDLDSPTDRPYLRIIACRKHKPASRIPRLRSIIRYKYIYNINDKKSATRQDINIILDSLLSQGVPTCTITFIADPTDLPSMSPGSLLQIYFDQLSDIHSHLADIYSPHSPRTTKLDSLHTHYDYWDIPRPKNRLVY